MLIGLVGFIGSGKGAAGDFLVEHHGFKRDAFAAGVKDACAAIFGWDRKLLEGDTSESRAFREEIDPYWTKAFGKEFTPRLALQLMGTEAGRNVFHNDLWIHSLLRRVKSNDNTVITDVRFPNELKAISDNGGYNVWIKRGILPDWYNQALLVNGSSNVQGNEIPGVHYSEWAWIGNHNVNHMIFNDRTLEDLHNEIYRYTTHPEKRNENI